MYYQVYVDKYRAIESLKEHYQTNQKSRRVFTKCMLMITKESKVSKEYYQAYVGKYKGIGSLDEYYWSITNLKLRLFKRITEGDSKSFLCRYILNRPVGTCAGNASFL